MSSLSLKRRHEMKKSDLICPLLKEPCIREKCICFSTRDYDIIGVPCEPYGTCEHLKINLDYEREDTE